MQKVGDVTDTATADSEFTDGSVASGISPTLLLAAIFNTWQRELCNVVTGSGAELDPANDGQVLEAIQAIIAGNASVSGALQKTQNLADLLDKAASRDNLELGDAATKSVGTTAGTVAAGDDARFGTGLTWDDIYPVGSEFSSYTDNRNPVDIIGIGTWSPVVGMIAGVGAATDSQGLTANYTAGYQAGWWRPQNGHLVAQALSVALTMNALDPHAHGYDRAYNSAGTQEFYMDSNGNNGGYNHINTDGVSAGTPTGTGVVTIGSGAATEGVAFFNPYYGKYIWVRTA